MVNLLWWSSSGIVTAGYTSRQSPMLRWSRTSAKNSLVECMLSTCRRRRIVAITPNEGLQRLIDHVEGDWDSDVLAQPRIVLISERFPLQVLTTARWLASVSGRALTIECHEVKLFRLPGDEP